MKLEIPSLEDCVKQIKEEGWHSLYIQRLDNLFGKIEWIESRHVDSVGRHVVVSTPKESPNLDFDPVQEAKDFIAEMERGGFKDERSS